MSISPIERNDSLRVGSVEFVSPEEIKVLLDSEAPDSVAANSGSPRTFPRINAYVLIATEAGFIVAQIEWIAIERLPFPRQKGIQDVNFVGLPMSLRKMRVNPLGILKTQQEKYIFERGVYLFPSIGDPVIIPTDDQLNAIVESGQNRRVKIGTSPLAANADIYIDPDRLFGRHLAVLGNTGSGKSCSVAGLIQWSLRQVPKNSEVTHPNGEYTKVFGSQARVFQVGSSDYPLQVPLWLWNSSEWSTFAQASAKAQMPILKKALRLMRNENSYIDDDKKVKLKRFLGSILLSIKDDLNCGNPWTQFPRPKNFYEKMTIWLSSIKKFKQDLEEDTDDLNSLIAAMEDYINNPKRKQTHPIYEAEQQEVDNIVYLVDIAFKYYGGEEKELFPICEDAPIRFNSKKFIDILEFLAEESGNTNYLEFLIARIRTLCADTTISSIMGDNVDINLADWLENYIGNDSDDKCVTVIDLSLVPTEVTHIITAVIARVTFETLQQYRKINGKSLPTVLVMEEAHTFIKRYRDDLENPTAASVCCQIFEKIAREGRKFGLGLLLSSQRPSELSPTVLSQCNSFLLHRISNDKDQELVNRLVPDNFRGLLRELPTLPSQQAILLGWATELPTVVKMNDLREECRPHSADPNFLGCLGKGR